VTDWPCYSEEEINAVVAVLRSGQPNYWGGNEGRSFENEFASFHGMPHAVALANGTVALELALHALGIGQGDEVIVTPRTFIASASCILQRGARPVFADVDADSQNITPDSVRAVLSERTRAIIAVHLAGWPCDMPGLQDLAARQGLMLIEDCAQAHGASIDGQLVGSFGDAAAFSFCTDKIMTTGGEGGMLLLRDEQAWRRAWSYKDHGKDWDAVYNREHPPGHRWQVESFGTNWRLPEMQSALGRVQLRHLPDWVARRQANAKIIHEALGKLPAVRITTPPPAVSHAYYKYYTFVRPERLKPGWTRDRIVKSLQDQGVNCLQGSCSEVYLEAAFDGTDMRPPARLPVAKALGETSLMFQVHPTLSEADMERMAKVIARVLQQAAA